ncbi:MAG: hypothetical protein DCC67_17740, partial [Planctomycetota bacterium]
MLVEPMPTIREASWLLSGQLTANQPVQSFPISTSPFLVGRHPHASLSIPSPTVSTAHAELRIGDSVFMMGGEWPDHGMKAPLPNHVSGGLHIYVENVDKAFERALSAGCSVAMPVMEYVTLC